MLTNITPYIYGTTRLGDDSIPETKRIDIALMAMDAGVWFHTSHQYNSALSILRKAFDHDRTKVPVLIIKLGGNTIGEFRENILNNIRPLGIESIDVGQLCIGGQLAEEFAGGGKCYEQFEQIRKEGLVKSYVMEVFPWTSEISLKALRGEYSNQLVDAHIFYLNPLQRFASNPLWNLLMKKKAPVIAMRTVSGGPIHMLRDVPGFAWKKYLQERASAIAPIFERSGHTSWTEFCVRFAHSIPGVLATVGSSGRIENLKEFLAAKENLVPLPKVIVDEIGSLHTRWSDEMDMYAEAWSM